MMTRDEAEAAARKGAKVRHEDWQPDEWIELRKGGAQFDEQGGHLLHAFDFYGPDNGWSIVESAPTPTLGTVLPLSEGDLRYCYADCGKEAPECICRAERNVTPAMNDAAAALNASHDAPAPVEPALPPLPLSEWRSEVSVWMATMDARMTAIENIVIPTPPNTGEHDSIMAGLRGFSLPPEPSPAFRTSRKPDAPGVMTDDDIVKAAGMATEPYSGSVSSISGSVSSMINNHVREAIRFTRQSVLAQLTANEERAVKAGTDTSLAGGYITDAIRAALAAIREGL